MLAVLAPELNGHRLHWLQALLLDATTNVLEVLVFTCDHEVINRLQAPTENSNISFCIEANTSNLINKWAEQLRNQQVTGLVLEADKHLHKLLFIRGKMRILILRPYLEGINLFGFGRFFMKQLLMLIIDKRKSVILARLSIPYSRQKRNTFKWVRDNFNTEEFLNRNVKAKEIFDLSQIPLEAKIVTLPGYLQARKNPQKIYQTFKEMNARSSTEYFLIFAGKQDECFKAEILKIGPIDEVIQIDRILSDGEFLCLIQRTDLIYLPYSNRGASGIVLNSLVVGTPVLLSGGFNWRKLEKLLDGQLSISSKSSAKTVRKMLKLLEQPKKSKLKLLTDEGIPTVRDFFLGNS